VAEAAGLEVEPITALGRVEDRSLLGATWFEQRTLFVERGQSPARRRFTLAHELMHALCPWHRAALRTDTASELFGPVHELVEAEANAGAGLLIFGGSSFLMPEAVSMPQSLTLARVYGASLHATLHHCVEKDRSASALLVAGRFEERDGTLPVWRSIESGEFRRRHGRAVALVPHGLPAGSALRELAEAARVSREPAPIAVTLGGRRFMAEAHDNRHSVFVLLRPHAGRRAVRHAA
jgi:hypothetical protein